MWPDNFVSMRHCSPLLVWNKMVIVMGLAARLVSGLRAFRPHSRCFALDGNRILGKMSEVVLSLEGWGCGFHSAWWAGFYLAHQA